jgi:hypothetical protein
MRLTRHVACMKGNRREYRNVLRKYGRKSPSRTLRIINYFTFYFREIGVEL